LGTIKDINSSEIFSRVCKGKRTKLSELKGKTMMKIWTTKKSEFTLGNFSAKSMKFNSSNLAQRTGTGPW
jgi:hypothetical protein